MAYFARKPIPTANAHSGHAHRFSSKIAIAAKYVASAQQKNIRRIDRHQHAARDEHRHDVVQQHRAQRQPVAAEQLAGQQVGDDRRADREHDRRVAHARIVSPKIAELARMMYATSGPLL